MEKKTKNKTKKSKNLKKMLKKMSFFLEYVQQCHCMQLL